MSRNVYHVNVNGSDKHYHVTTDGNAQEAVEAFFNTKVMLVDAIHNGAMLVFESLTSESTIYNVRRLELSSIDIVDQCLRDRIRTLNTWQNEHSYLTFVEAGKTMMMGGLSLSDTIKVLTNILLSMQVEMHMKYCPEEYTDNNE